MPVPLFFNRFEGTDGSTTLVDDIPGNTWGIENSAEIDTAQAKNGSSSLLIPSGVNEWADVTGWASPHKGWWSCSGYVRWDAAYGVGLLPGVQLVDLSGNRAIWIYFRGDGSYIIEIAGPLVGFATGGGSILGELDVDFWHSWEVKQNTNTGKIEIYWDGALKFATTFGFGQTYAIEECRIHNDTTANVWFDDVQLLGDRAEPESLEFDYEIGSDVSLEQIIAPSGTETTFIDRPSPDRYRRIVVEECIRRMRAKNACRRFIAKPAVVN